MMCESLEKVMKGENGNYIFPFLWMKGESQQVIEEELKQIYDCGIRAICIESRPHPDFLGEGWWRDMDFIMAWTRKKGMRVWLLDDAHFPTGYANHLIPEKYPERRKVYINYNVMDVWGAKTKVLMPIDCMMQPKTTWMDLGKPSDSVERANNKLLAITAYLLVEDGKIDLDSGLDLKPFYADGKVEYQFPEGNWRIYVIYETRTDGGNPDYINIIDEASVEVLIEAVYEPHYQRYRNDFGDTFAGFFSDEPGFGNVLDFNMDDIIGKKQMPLPWNQDVPRMLKECLGGLWTGQLAALWAETTKPERTAQIRLAYMDTVTTLYAKNFCGQLGRWCEERHAEYVGHVIEDNGEHARLGCGAGHYFRAMSGQHMSGIDSIGQQIMPGGAQLQHMSVTPVSGKFNHYVLAKLGSSSAHLDPKKGGRALCEACGAYGWKFGVRDMKWLIDHLLVQGINQFVPHAFSMAEYPDNDCSPHFYARGNNPQYRHFAELMKYTNRMCELLNNGCHGARTAVLYQAEAEWMGEYLDMADVAQILTNHQIDFDFVPVDVLADLKSYKGSVENGYMRINSQEYRLLLIPYGEYIPMALDQFMTEHPEFDIQFVGGYPKYVVSPCKWRENNRFVKKGGLLQISELADYVKEKVSSVVLDKVFPALLVYDYIKDSRMFLFFNADMYQTYDGDVWIEGEHSFLCYE